MKLFRLLLSYSPPAVITAVLVGLVSGGASAGLLAVLNMRLNGDDRFGAALPLVFAALVLIAPLGRVLSAHLMIRLSQRGVHELRMRLSRRILASPLRRLEAVGPDRLLAAIIQDVGSITNALANLPLLFIHGAIVVGALAYLASLSWHMFLVLLFLIVVGALSYQLPMLFGQRLHRRSREMTDAIYKRYGGIIHGSKELKLHSGRREAQLGMLDASGSEVRRLNVAMATIYESAASWGQMLFFVVVGLLLFVGVDLVPGLSQEMLVGYTLVILYLMTPMEILLDSLPNLVRANVALEKIERLGLSLVSEAEEVLEPPGEGPAAEQRLELAGVEYTHHNESGDVFRVGPLDLTLEPGEIVFVIGGNGSGKTTFAKLLLGLYYPDGGEIRIDGVPVTPGNRQRYRQRFSAVFADYYLFDHLGGVEGGDLDEKAASLLRRLELEGKVEIRDRTFSTVELSQGQRKRLALLTSFLEDRSFYVFDEWAADQDPAFKSFFYRELLPELKRRGKTVVVVTHDDRYFALADRLLKLENGRLVRDERPERRRPAMAVGGAGGEAVSQDG